MAESVDPGAVPQVIGVVFTEAGTIEHVGPAPMAAAASTTPDPSTPDVMVMA